MDEATAQMKAIAAQREIVTQLTGQGYQIPQAQRMAKLWAPTPAQARMRNAREKKGKGNGGKRARNGKAAAGASGSAIDEA
jgi:hypothetical protein